MAAALGSAAPVAAEEPAVFIEPSPGGDSYVARGSGFGALLGQGRVTFMLYPATREEAERSRPGQMATSVTMVFGGQPSTRMIPLDPFTARSNYFIGNDPSRWRSNVPRFGRVRYEDAYPHIDLDFYSTPDGRLEFDFLVHPGARPEDIRFSFDGAEETHVDPRNGDLVVAANGREALRHHAPRAYQKGPAEEEIDVLVSFLVGKDGTVSMEIGPHDGTRDLVIDPPITQSTFLGGTRSESWVGTTVDDEDSVYVVGMTTSKDFPLVGPLPPEQWGPKAPSGNNIYNCLDRGLML